MHQITPTEGQRIDDRIRAPASETAYPPAPRRTACTANRCNSGDRKCPCPTELQIPEPDAITAVNTALIVAGYLLANKWVRFGAAIVGVMLTVHFWPR